MPIDELVTWRQLAGDPRLSGASAECDARGWDALPLAAEFLFPTQWRTGKAVERWISKNPPDAYRDIIRVGGLLSHTGAPGKPGGGSRRWCGMGPMRGRRSAEVLGVRADILLVRGSAQQARS
jgi:hypothetical protein